MICFNPAKKCCVLTASQKVIIDAYFVDIDIVFCAEVQMNYVDALKKQLGNQISLFSQALLVRSNYKFLKYISTKTRLKIKNRSK